MQTEVVRSCARFMEIGPAWHRLWHASGSGVFQSHGWIAAWWKGRDADDGMQLAVGLAWVGGDLIAVIPCTTRPHRRLRVLEWAAKVCSDYCDVLLDPRYGSDPTVLTAVWRAMANAGRPDVIYLSHVREGSIVSKLANDPKNRVALRPGHRTEQTLQVCSDVATGMDWFRTQSKKARNNHLRGMRILSEEGMVTVAVHTADGPEISGILERMIALKLDWLAQTGRKSVVLANEGRILRGLVTDLGRQGVIRLFTITRDDAFVAGSVNIAHAGGMAAFFAAYDPSYERASPGTLMMVEYIKWAFDHDIRSIDFLCGDEEYKFKFANCQTELATYVGARTILGYVALGLGERLDRRRAVRGRTDAVSPPATMLQRLEGAARRAAHRGQRLASTVGQQSSHEGADGLAQTAPGDHPEYRLQP